MRVELYLKPNEKYEFAISKLDKSLLIRELTHDIILESDTFSGAVLSRLDTVDVESIENETMRFFNNSSEEIYLVYQLSQLLINMHQQNVAGAIYVDEISKPVNVERIIFPVEVSNLPGVQTVSGAVEVSNIPAVQTVSGAVEVSNIPAVQAVSGNLNVNNFPDAFNISNLTETNDLLLRIEEQLIMMSSNSLLNRNVVRTALAFNFYSGVGGNLSVGDDTMLFTNEKRIFEESCTPIHSWGDSFVLDGAWIFCGFSSDNHLENLTNYGLFQRVDNADKMKAGNIFLDVINLTKFTDGGFIADVKFSDLICDHYLRFAASEGSEAHKELASGKWGEPVDYVIPVVAQTLPYLGDHELEQEQEQEQEQENEQE